MTGWRAVKPSLRISICPVMASSRMMSPSCSFAIGPPAAASGLMFSVNGKTLYRVRAEGYADKAEADAAAEALAQDFGLSKPWIGRQGS